MKSYSSQDACKTLMSYPVVGLPTWSYSKQTSTMVYVPKTGHTK